VAAELQLHNHASFFFVGISKDLLISNKTQDVTCAKQGTTIAGCNNKSQSNNTPMFSKQLQNHALTEIENSSGKQHYE